MILKMRYLAIVSLLVMLFSGVVCGKNLLIGGIGENGSNPSDNPNYVAIANQLIDSSGNPAVYVPTYYHLLPNGQPDDIENYKDVRNAAIGERTDQNGLNQRELKGKHYDTIVAYSGGTATALTALANEGVTCDTLILISPMAAGITDDKTVKDLEDFYKKGNKNLADWVNVVKPYQDAIDTATNNFNSQVNQILTEKTSDGKPIVGNIVVIQSKQDNLPYGNIYQYRFQENADRKIFKNNADRITVHNIDDLKSNGVDAHKELFFDYAKANLKTDNNGKVYYVPNQQNSNAALGSNAAAVGASVSSKTSPTDTSQSSAQETSTVAVDAFSVGNPQSPVKGQDTSPIDTSKSNIQEPAQTELTVNDKNFPIGSRVETTNSLNVRSGPGLSYNTVSESPEATGSMATTLAEPVKADGFTWYQIKYDDGTTGWSEDKRLELAPSNTQDKQPATQSSGPSFGDNQKQQPSTTTSPKPTGKIKPVTLILYVNEGNQNGHAIIGAEVTGQDGSGKSFQQTTDSHGSVIISGNPGTWSFSASAFGYETKSWSQLITETCPQHASLQKIAVKTNLQFGSNTSVAQDSGNSVVGKWDLQNLDYKGSWTFSFNKDGTFDSIPAGYYPGTWVQTGNVVRFGSNSDWDWEGTITGNIMSCTVSHTGAYNEVVHWKGVRADT